MHNLLHSSSRRGRRDRSVLSRRPGSRPTVAARLRRPSHLEHTRLTLLVRPYRHGRETSSRSTLGLMNGQPTSAFMARRGTRCRVLNFTICWPSSVAQQRRGCSRSTSKRASHALAVHEPQQRPLPGHREAPGRTPPDAYQPQHGYGPAALLATHLPAKPALQDHEGSHYSPGI
jgi:hypothetical protein